MSEKIAVMVSGGLDSFILYEYAISACADEDVEIIPMMVLYGSPYETKEVEAAYTLFGDKLKTVHADLAIPELDNVPTLKQQEIFGRNLLILFYGAVIADRVWLGSLETEMNPTAVRDKHPEFIHMCSTIFSYVFKGRRFETVVEAPFKKYTKSDIVWMARNQLGITETELKATTTCYHEGFHNCGMCSTCFKRWIAMTNNGIEEEDYQVHPYESNEYGQDIVEKMRLAIAFGKKDPRFSDKRLAETHNALVRNGFQGLYAHSELICGAILTD